LPWLNEVRYLGEIIAYNTDHLAHMIHFLKHFV